VTEILVEKATFLLQESRSDSDAGPSKRANPPSADKRVRVFHPDGHFPDPG
jgi:hypothetical protein